MHSLHSCRLVDTAGQYIRVSPVVCRDDVGSLRSCSQCESEVAYGAAVSSLIQYFFCVTLIVRVVCDMVAVREVMEMGTLAHPG